MEKEITLAEIAKILEKYEIVELEDVKIKGDIELELAEGGMALPPSIVQALQSIISAAHISSSTTEAIATTAQALQSIIGVGAGAGGVQKVQIPTTPAEEFGLIHTEFKVAKTEWKGQIEEVTIGATSADGGTREETVTIGGEKALPFYNFDYQMPHPPVISVDCFDMPITLAKAVRGHYEDVMEDPGEWAKKNVREFGADMVTIHLISTDPTIKDT
ncbi:MAG: acetyl-CoA synthase subunit delta, partial [Euryarchaeota archaeon]|nr:acetyl-CoA synthase subunit delta [Euryarchaeota archaeon]